MPGKKRGTKIDKKPAPDWLKRKIKGKDKKDKAELDQTTPSGVMGGLAMQANHILARMEAVHAKGKIDKKPAPQWLKRKIKGKGKKDKAEDETDTAARKTPLSDKRKEAIRKKAAKAKERLAKMQQQAKEMQDKADDIDQPRKREALLDKVRALQDKIKKFKATNKSVLGSTTAAIKVAVTAKRTPKGIPSFIHVLDQEADDIRKAITALIAVWPKADEAAIQEAVDEVDATIENIGLTAKGMTRKWKRFHKHNRNLK